MQVSGWTGRTGQLQLQAERKRTSVKRRDTDQEGMRSGQRTTVRKHFMADVKQLESLWVVTKGALCVYDWIHVCVRVIQRQREQNRTAPVGSAWWSID
ncbi:hypothetical protein PBY51_006788 [Eleginops maclovinus]|uniref:Uncharacterized protein n=1 Tax=Eleginops maclovinus TaxID=56733 RepID=A0AAN8AAK4_ELEMC|nr:hypothetical protein PBY51_006788 [Eleginops maclovinus]